MKLSEQCMIVRLSMSQWTARKFDKTATNEVAATHGNRPDIGRYNKILVEREEIQKIGKITGAARTWHYANTLPWGDDGARILPATHYQVYSAKMREFRAEFETQVSAFVLAYPRLISEARTLLNGLYRPEDYPTTERIQAKYQFSVQIDPLPDAEDFRVSVGSMERATIQQDITARVQSGIAAANRDLWERLHTAISHMSEALSTPDKIFRDSLVGNIAELCELLPRLNITGDAKLEAMAQEAAARLTGANAQTLRDNNNVRSQVAQEAARIAEQMKGIMGPQ